MLLRTPRLLSKDEKLIEEVLRLRESLGYAIRTPRRWSGLLRRVSLAGAVRGSNSIEGYRVTLDDALAAVENEEPLEAQSEAWAAVKNYQLAMTYVVQLAADPYFEYSNGLIRALHFMMQHYDYTKNPGRWRPGPVYVRDESTNEVVYEGPSAERVPPLMRELVAFLRDADHVPVMVRAALAHLNLAMIHPFSDGNGRMARCLQTLILSREKILEPAFCSIEEWLGEHTTAYYKVLANVGKGSWHPENDTHQWIAFTLEAHHDQAMRTLRRIKERERVSDMIEEEVKRRGLSERTALALHDAAFGLRVRNATYHSAAEITVDTATRDLKELVDAGLLEPHGEKKNRYYVATAPLLAMRDRGREPKPDDTVTARI